MIRSRLRRPTSKSITTTFLPRRARPHARLALLVVLPTPPLPDVTTMISAKGFSPGFVVVRDGAGGVGGVSLANGHSSTAIFNSSFSSQTCTALPCSSFGMSSRSEEHTSELQSLMRTSYAVFCLKKTNTQYHTSSNCLYTI